MGAELTPFLKLTFDLGTVLENGSHGVLVFLNPSESTRIPDRNPPIVAFLTSIQQEVLEHGSGDRQPSDVPVCRHEPSHPIERARAFGVDVDGVVSTSSGPEARFDADLLVEDAHRVGGDENDTPDVLGSRVSFEDGRADSLACESRSEGGSSEAGTDDDDVGAGEGEGHRGWSISILPGCVMVFTTSLKLNER